MPKLYSYCIINDHGAAPNPFWGICTLAICKPVIRRSAQIGDWIVATGSSKYGFENQLVYAMKVSEIMSLEEYDAYCKNKLPNKIPVYKTIDLRLKVGDCIYDYSNGQPHDHLLYNRSKVLAFSKFYSLLPKKYMGCRGNKFLSSSFISV